MELQRLKRKFQAQSWVALAAAAVSLGVAAWAGSEKPATLVIYLLVGLMELAAAALGLAGVGRAPGARTAGEVHVQSSWWVLSVGFAGLLLFPSKFFHVGATPVAVALCVIWIVVGCYGLFSAHRETGVPVNP